MTVLRNLFLRLALVLMDSAKGRVGVLHALVHKHVVPHLFRDFGADSTGVPYIVDQSGTKIFLSSTERAHLYRRGVACRLAQLVDQYGLTEILAEGVQTFVDVGANIGEFGVGFSGNQAVTYVAFEPDRSAFMALSKNAPNGILINKALSDYTGESIFHLATSTADSSLLLPTVAVENQVQTEVTTLDAALREAGVTNIDILKIEAEGSEPEVLRGAKKTLRRTNVCVVDAGPERYGASTAPECIGILQSAGFRLIDLRFPRGILVFVSSDRKPREN